MYDLVTDRELIPDGATADDIADIIRAILRRPLVVKSITVSADDRNVEWTAFVPKVEPPYGEIPAPPPQNYNELMSNVGIIDFDVRRAKKVNLKALSLIAGMLFEVSRRKGVATAWLVHDAKAFGAWVMRKSIKKAPTRFLGLRIVEESSLIPADRVILLAGRSVTSDPLDSTVALSLAVDMENANEAQNPRDGS